MNHLFLVGCLLGCAALASAGIQQGTAKAKETYSAELAKWRKQQEVDLKADEGFLSVAGLFWLKEGDNTFGADASCAVKLPTGSTAGVAGILNRHDGQVTLTLNPGVSATLKGQNVTSTPLALDSDRITLGALRFMAIRRGNRIGIRLWDRNCKGYTEFKGLKWYAPNPKCVVKAKFVPYDPPKMVDITNVLGDTQPVPVVGYLEFVLAGKTLRLDAQGTGEGLFINFRDLTSGNETYPAGRFLDAPKPVNGEVLIDFNRATNPPCAFTSFATCPLPPRQNYLPVAITAGEKTHHPAGE